MDTFSINDISDLTPEEVLTMYTRRIAYLSSLIYTSTYILGRLEKSRGNDPKKIEKIERLMMVAEVMREEFKTISAHLNLDD